MKASGVRVALLGGRFDGARATVTQTPYRVEIDRVSYLRVDDPDTGEFLGGYVAEDRS